MKPTTFLLLLFLSSSTIQAIEQGFVPLFNGKDLSGWTQLGGKADFKVEDGAIVGTTAAKTPNSFLTTRRHYADFDLRFEVKLDHDQLNSGCQIRSNASPDFHRGSVHGYQCEIESQNGTAGFIYDERRRGWLSKQRKDVVKNQAYRPGTWNQFRILCQGDSIKTWVNGVAIADLTDGMTRSGFIGLQVHKVPGDPHWQVRWRNLRIKELPTQPRQRHQASDFTTTGNWTFNNNQIELVPRKGESGWKRFESYLWLKQLHGDFVCSFEYQHPKGGNSGFYFRTRDRSDPVKTGIEIQIIDSHGKRGRLTEHDCGGVVQTRPPSRNMAKPAGQWNRMEIRCEAKHLKVWLNGEKIQDMYLDRTGLKDQPLRGHIGFQDHGFPFKLRNLLIEEL